MKRERFHLLLPPSFFAKIKHSAFFNYVRIIEKGQKAKSGG